MKSLFFFFFFDTGLTADKDVANEKQVLEKMVPRNYFQKFCNRPVEMQKILGKGGGGGGEEGGVLGVSFGVLDWGWLKLVSV